MKMHLRAKVPNEGARRLCWWLAVSHDRGVEKLAEIGIDRVTIDRLLAGELEPGADMSHAIFLATGCAVCSRDWRAPAQGGWGDRPAPRQALAA